MGAYRAIVAELRGATVKSPDAYFAERASRVTFAFEAQVDGWKAFYDESGGALQVGWDPRRKTPAAVTGWSPALEGKSPIDAWEDFVASRQAEWDALFQIGPDDQLVLDDVTHGNDDYGPSGPPPSHERALLIYRRVHAGFRVPGDGLFVTLTRELDEASWRLGGISADWMRELPPRKVSDSPQVMAGAVGAAKAHLEAKGATPVVTSAEAVYVTADIDPVFAYRITAESGQGPVLLYVEPESMSVVLEASLEDHDTYEATVQAEVGLPYDQNQDESEATGKRARSVASVTVYRDAWQETLNSITGTTGDPSTTLGGTDTSGGYSITYTGGDTSWVVDPRGDWTHDMSHHCSNLELLMGSEAGGYSGPGFTCASDISFPITAGSPFTQAQTESNHKTRRLEIHRYIEYFSRMMDHSSIGLPGFSNLRFLYAQETGTSGAQSPTNFTAGIRGLARPSPSQFPGGHPGITVRAPDDMDDLASYRAEQRLRGVVLHETGHTLRYKYNGNGTSCSTGTIDGMKCLCRGYEEGRADFAKVAAGRLEDVRGEYRPVLKYPLDYYDQISGSCGTTPYTRAAIFTALYAEYGFRVGSTESLYHVHHHVGSVTSSDPMVCWEDQGSGFECTGTFDDLPATSYYRRLMTSAMSSSSGSRHRGAEVSAVFHNRVDDGDDSDGVDETPFPWRDDVPNGTASGALTPGTETSTSSIHSDGPVTGTWGSGDLRLDYATDKDSYQFLGRAGETYRIETLNLGGAANTKLEILNLSGFVLATNTNCSLAACSWCRSGGDANHSCYEFAPDATQMYVARVSVNGENPQYLGTYDLRVELLDDDAGDFLEASNPAPASGLVSGTVNTNTDEDWYHVYAAGDFTIKLCAPSGSTPSLPMATIYDPSGSSVITYTEGACPGTTRTVTVSTPGLYRVRVKARNEASSGTYELNVTNTGTDQDVDDTVGNAIPVSLAVDEGRALGLYLDVAGESDWIALDAEAGYVYNIATWDGAGVDSSLELYAPLHVGLFGTDAPPVAENPTLFKSVLYEWSGQDTSGQQLGYWMMGDEESALNGTGAALTFTAPVRGTYFVRVRNGAEADAGNSFVLLSRSHYTYTTLLELP